MKYSFAQVRKAAAAFAGTAIAIFIAAARAKGKLDSTDYVSAAVAGVLAGAAVFWIPNAPATAPVAAAPLKT